MWRLWLTFVVLLAVQENRAEALDPLSTFFGVLSAAYKSYFADHEVCTDDFIKLNYAGLKNDLAAKLYGQQLASQTLLKSVKAHFRDPNPRKPLVLSFHGWYGVGKNFVARMLVKNIYKKKDKSSFVHFFNSELHFQHAKKIDTYKDQLHEWIYHNVSKCGHSIFIFDEVDNMPEGLINTLTPFLDSASHYDGVDFRKCIFIFLSNTGASKIVKMSLESWKSEEGRQSIRLRDVQEVLKISAYYENGGFKKSRVVEKSLIDHFIAFLPLERTHVRRCVYDEIQRQKLISLSKDAIENVLDELQWYPTDLKVYSASGCKNLAQKVAIHEPDSTNQLIET